MVRNYQKIYPKPNSHNLGFQMAEIIMGNRKIAYVKNIGDIERIENKPGAKVSGSP